MIVVKIRALGIRDTSHHLQVKSHGPGARNVGRGFQVQQTEHSLHALCEDGGDVDGSEDPCGSRVAEVFYVEA